MATSETILKMESLPFQPQRMTGEVTMPASGGAVAKQARQHKAAHYEANEAIWGIRKILPPGATREPCGVFSNDFEDQASLRFRGLWSIQRPIRLRWSPRKGRPGTAAMQHLDSHVTPVVSSTTSRSNCSARNPDRVRGRTKGESATRCSLSVGCRCAYRGRTGRNDSGAGVRTPRCC